MFERFTDRARRVIVIAQEASRSLNHNYIGVEHIILALLQEGDGVGARVMKKLGITEEEIRSHIGPGDTIVVHGHIPFTPRSKKVMELALREALQLGHSYIGTEHILLACVREGGTLTQALLGNIELLAVRREVMEVLSGQVQQQKRAVMHIVGIRGYDDRYHRMKDAYYACKSAEVEPPAAVTEYFGDKIPAATELVEDLASITVDWTTVNQTGLELEVAKLPEGLAKIRFYVS